MSGTSLDGIDIAFVNFTKDKTWSYKFLNTKTVEYPKKWVKKLKNLINEPFRNVEIEDDSYTLFLAKQINDFVRDNNLQDVDAICSHGHTIFHEPKKGLTYQIGNKKTLAIKTGIKLICDFRKQDVALGGQGAPLVPIGDKLLFRNFDSCLNLGGFANLSQNIDAKILAYDICAVNTVLNHLSNKRGELLDFNGKGAKRGNFISSFFNILEGFDYYTQKGPKSLGLEWVKLNIYPIIQSHENNTVEDLLHTYTIHIAKQIGSKFKNKEKVLVTGGGAKNLFLINEIKNYSSARFFIPSNELIDFKEALIFGFLGVLRLRNETNCLASVTGSSKDHCSGIIYTP